jgi:hypothetical protein
MNKLTIICKQALDSYIDNLEVIQVETIDGVCATTWGSTGRDNIVVIDGSGNDIILVM